MLPCSPHPHLQCTTEGLFVVRFYEICSVCQDASRPPCFVQSHRTTALLCSSSLAFPGREDVLNPWNIWNALSTFLLRHLLLHGYVYVCVEVITPSCPSALSSDLVSSAKLHLTLQAGLGASPLYSSQSCPLQSTCHIVLGAQLSALPMWAPWG